MGRLLSLGCSLCLAPEGGGACCFLPPFWTFGTLAAAVGDIPTIPCLPWSPAAAAAVSCIRAGEGGLE